MRHREREQEHLKAERLRLLDRLGDFMPPPFADLRGTDWTSPRHRTHLQAVIESLVCGRTLLNLNLMVREPPVHALGCPVILRQQPTSSRL